MKYLLFTFILIIISCCFSLIYKEEREFTFLSRYHTALIKGLAILIIVLCHMSGIFGVRYLTPLGGIGVSIFLICSGYGLVESYKKVGLMKFWTKKLKNIFIPYLIIEVIATFFRGATTLKSVILDILILNTRHPFGWYMKYLLLWYLIFYFAAKINLLSKQRLFIFYFISFILMFNQKDLWAEQSFSFVLGISISFYKDLDILKKKKLSILLLIIGIFFLLLKQVNTIRTLPFIYFNYIQLLIKLPVAFSLILCIWQFKKLILSRMLYLLGQISYAIYLIHGYSIKILTNLSYISITIFLVITVLASIFFMRILSFIYQFKFNRIIKNTLDLE